MDRHGTDLVLAARLRSEIATLARGGEYSLAHSLLLELAAVDLRAGLRADALLRTRQASKLAADSGNLEEELRSMLLLAVTQIEAESARDAEQTVDTVLFRTTNLNEESRAHIVSTAYLVRGMASRRCGSVTAARVALEQCRVRAARIHRADLSALALAELGAVELSSGDAAAAAVCFWFARDAYRLLARDREARAVELLALTAFLESGRVDEAIELARDALAEADQRDDPETAARAAGLYADALIARGDLDAARRAADDAAERVRGLGDRARGLGVGARLRQVRLEREPEQQVRHLEAAIDLALSLRDSGAIARALDVAVGGLVAGTLPSDGWRAVADLARGSRELGLAVVADVADAALAELRP